MYGQINKQRLLGELLCSTPDIKEVYVDMDFSFEQDFPNLYIHAPLVFNVCSFQRKLFEIFDEHTKVYVANNADAILFQQRKLLWRNGRWYC